MTSSLVRLATRAAVRAAVLGAPRSPLAAPLAHSIRHHWNYQYKPGPYPQTVEERAAAAKKYGLTIEEYQPYPEEEGYGDYPKLPDIGDDSKDPHYPWDYPENKRNFNEPIHAMAVIYREDRTDPSAKLPIPIWKQWIWFLGTISGFWVIYQFLEEYKMGRPVTNKQYPGAGPHYTFETQ